MKILGFGPTNLIERLRRSEWTSFSGDSKNFDSISLGGYCLTIPADKLCNTHFTIKVNREWARTNPSLLMDSAIHASYGVWM